jgi:hypothetical protein
VEEPGELTGVEQIPGEAAIRFIVVTRPGAVEAADDYDVRRMGRLVRHESKLRS